MKAIRIYRHPNCNKCARFARMHHRFDWLNKVEDATTPPPGRSPVRKGEIVIETLADGRIHEGVDAAKSLVKAIPLYWAVLPFLFLPPVGKRVDKNIRGGNSSCAVTGFSQDDCS